MGSVSPEVVELVARIELFCQSPMRSGGEELGDDMREFRRGMDLLEVRFSEMAAAFAATDHYDVAGAFYLMRDREKLRKALEKTGPGIQPIPWSYLGPPVEIYQKVRESVGLR